MMTTKGHDRFIIGKQWPREGKRLAPGHTAQSRLVGWTPGPSPPLYPTHLRRPPQAPVFLYPEHLRALQPLDIPPTRAHHLGTTYPLGFPG